MSGSWHSQDKNVTPKMTPKSWPGITYQGTELQSLEHQVKFKHSQVI